MDHNYNVAKMNRTLLLSFLENFTLEQLNKVPKGFKNNIYWNIAHVVVTQQLLVYHLSGLPMLVDGEMVDAYRKGTKVEGEASQEDVETLKKLLFSTIEKTKEDLANGVFKNYNEYTTSTNFTIHNIEDALAFNNYHEGIHLGYILALKKSL